MRKYYLIPGWGYLTRKMTGMCVKTPTLCTRLHKNAPKSISCRTQSVPKIYKINCMKRTLKSFLPHDTLSHDFLINCNTLSDNFCQKRTPCGIIFTVKGYPVERHIPTIQACECSPPPSRVYSVDVPLALL